MLTEVNGRPDLSPTIADELSDEPNPFNKDPEHGEPAWQTKRRIERLRRRKKENPDYKIDDRADAQRDRAADSYGESAYDDMDDQRGIARAEISGAAYDELESELVDDVVKSAQRENPDLSRLDLRTFEDYAEEALGEAIRDMGEDELGKYIDMQTSLHAGEAFTGPTDEAIKDLAVKAMDKANNDAFNLHLERKL